MFAVPFDTAPPTIAPMYGCGRITRVAYMLFIGEVGIDVDELRTYYPASLIMPLVAELGGLSVGENRWLVNFFVEAYPPHTRGGCLNILHALQGEAFGRSRALARMQSEGWRVRGRTWDNEPVDRAPPSPVMVAS